MNFLKPILSELDWPFLDKSPEVIKFILSRVFPPDNPRLALKRALNLILTYIAWKKGIIINNLKPVALHIEPVRGCNFNCIMCRAGESTKKFMEPDKLKIILDKFPETIHVTFTAAGEPFLSRDLLDMIRYMSFERKLLVTVFSNFSVLPDPVQIINSGLYEMNVSIDSFNPEKFSKIREWGNLNIVLKNLKNLISTRNKLNRKLPIIIICQLFSKETKEDAEDIIKNAIELGVDTVRFFKFITSLIEDLMRESSEFAEDKEKFSKPVPKLTEADENDFKYLKHLKEKYKNKIKIRFTNFEWGKEPPRGYCAPAYFNTFIDVFGKTYPCCYHFHFHYTGIDAVTFGNILSNSQAMKMREKFIKNFRKEKPYLCSNCPFYFRK